MKDREGHDRRYALDCTKLMSLGWKPKIRFENGLRDTIQWYLNNQSCWKQIKNSEFMEYYRSNIVTVLQILKYKIMRDTLVRKECALC